MLATNIRTQARLKPSRKLTSPELETLCRALIAKTAKAGFHTDATILNSSAIKIGLHMSSFRVMTQKLGHNARIGRYVSSPKGYKRTDIPTWEQRVEFNDIVNDIFDCWKLTARIVSGPFPIRDKVSGRKTERDWYEQDGNCGVQYNGLGEKCSEILPESEAREQCNSDRLEAEHAAIMRERNRETSKTRRELLKQFKAAKKVTIAGFYGEKTQNDKQMTHAAFEKMLQKLSRRERRRIKQASILATVQTEKVGF